MDSMAAFMMGEANRGKEQKVFDWDLAAKLIKERKPSEASAGLALDWEYTGGGIFKDGEPTDKEMECPCIYLASTWATPELDMDGEIIPCYRMASEVPGWGSDTFWPESALAILKS